MDGVFRTLSARDWSPSVPPDVFFGERIMPDHRSRRSVRHAFSTLATGGLSNVRICRDEHVTAPSARGQKVLYRSREGVDVLHVRASVHVDVLGRCRIYESLIRRNALNPQQLDMTFRVWSHAGCFSRLQHVITGDALGADDRA